VWSFLSSHSDKFCKSFKVFFNFNVNLARKKYNSKKNLINFFGLHRLIPTQKLLNYSIPNNKVKIMKNFNLQEMKVENKSKAIFCSQFLKRLKE